MDPKEKLAQVFERFPGIGKRQARRFVDYMLRVSDSTVSDFVVKINDARSHTRQCRESWAMYTMSDGEKDVGLSPVAKNPNRDRTTIMIVETDHDMNAVENSKSYRGQYYLIGELLPLVADHFDEHPRSAHLLERIKKGIATDNLKEIIFALPLTTEGEHTKLAIENFVSPIATEASVTLSALARGLSTGSEIEYTDAATLESAIKGRK